MPLHSMPDTVLQRQPSAAKLTSTQRHPTSGTTLQPGVPQAVEERLKRRNKLKNKFTGDITISTPAKPFPESGPRSNYPPFAVGDGAKLVKPALNTSYTTLKGSVHSPYKTVHSAEDDVSDQIRQYERRINSLLDQVDLAKDNMGENQTAEAVRKSQEHLNASRQVISQQQSEIKDYRSELGQTMQQNNSLRRSLDLMQGKMDESRNETSNLLRRQEELMQKLAETEANSHAASEQVENLRLLVRKLKEEKKMTVADANSLLKQKELLLSRLNEFEASNMNLQNLLKQKYSLEAEFQTVTKQKDKLLRKLAEAENTVLLQEKQISELKNRESPSLSLAEKKQRSASKPSDLYDSMSTGQMLSELRRKELERAELCQLVKDLEAELESFRSDVERSQHTIDLVKTQAKEEKSMLKKSAKTFRDQAKKSDDTVIQLKAALADKNKSFQRMEAQMRSLEEVVSKLSQEKSSKDSDLHVIRSHVKELEQLLDNTERIAKNNVDSLNNKLVLRIQELSTLRIENENLKAEKGLLEEKIKTMEVSAHAKANFGQAELSQLQLSIQQYEDMVKDYKLQTERSWKENRELAAKLDQTQLCLSKTNKEAEDERSKIKAMHSEKLRELANVEEKLKSTSGQLSEAHAELASSRRKQLEADQLISDLTKRAEVLVDQLSHAKEKYRAKSEECKAFCTRIEMAESKATGLDCSVRDLQVKLAKRDEAVLQLQDNIKDLRSENSKLASQLRGIMEDAKRTAEIQREKDLARENATHSRVMDLESQLQKTTLASQQLKKAKEEAERKFNSRTQELKDRLEQANATTRSMQSYISFLKTTYANVVTDAEDSSASNTLHR